MKNTLIAYLLLLIVGSSANSWVKREFRIEQTSAFYELAMCKPWIMNCINYTSVPYPR